MSQRLTLVCGVVALFGVATSTVAAQDYRPVPGGEVLGALRSPLFLATAPNTASTESVSGDVINPAASALKQRVHLDAGYAAIVGDGAWSGHAGALGVTWPTPAGVFTGSVDVASADYAALDLGQRAGINVSFAKDLYPTLLFGAGARAHIGSNGGNMGFGGGVDLGIIHLLGPVGPFTNVRWGAAFTQLGVGLKPVDGTTGSPAPFTPAADIEATVLSTDAVTWAVHAGIAAPSFQNVRVRAGSRTTFLDRVSLNLGWDVDLREQTDSDRPAGSLAPSVGLTVRFQTGRSTGGADGAGAGEDPGWTQSDLAVHTAWAPLYDGVWAAGAGVQAALGVIDRDPPEVSLEYPETFYVSPNNDGAADEFLLPVTITDERFVQSWTLEIADDDGEVIRRIENKEQRPENVGFQNIIDRLLYVKKGVEIPEAIRWDGRTDDGGVAPDGTYRFTVISADDNGNRYASPEQTIVVDATAPEAQLPEPDDPDALIFSPNDDGNKDTLTIPQESSEEELWTLQILDASDVVVYEETVEDASLASFTWDGRDNQGTLVPDGVYAYRVASQDRALNEGSARLNNIIVNTAPTPIGLAVDRGHFSPNGDGRMDTVTVTPDVPVTEGIRSYTFTVQNAAGSAVRTATFADDTPQSWTFDGRADDGSALPEGDYTVRLSLVYRNGNRPEATSPLVQLDTTPPRLAVQADQSVFSPNGDGRLDTVTFLHETESIPRWEGRILNAQGDAVRTYAWSGRPDASLVWDGRNDQGERTADGTYRYELFGEDRAGNRRTSRPINVELDTRETPVFVSPSREAFSPDGDGSADSIELIPELADAQGVERFEMTILDDAGNPVARISDSGAPEDQYVWDGRGTDGTIVSDGEYSVRLTVDYRHGNRPSAVGTPFRVDTVDPNASVASGERIFSPDGDGDKDDITFTQESTNESLWTAEIVPVDGTTPVRRWSLSGTLSPLTWDGTTDDGEVVADGRYRYRVRSVDEAGNRFSTQSEIFQIDTREVDIAVRPSDVAFSPNGDGVKDSVTLTPSVTIDTPVAQWTVSVTDEAGATVWDETREGPLEAVVWDGTGRGGRAADGVYRPALSVSFARGDDLSVSAARSVTLDTTAPQAEVTLSSPVISPNGDGNLDELIITQQTSDEERWVARIFTAADREVGRWEWVGQAPERLAFAGLDTARRRVADGEYRYQLSATDAAGNSTTVGPRSFEIYTAETPLEVYPTTEAFSPNNDGVLDTVTFPVITGEARGLERYRFVVADEAGDDVFVDEGTRLPERFTWNGTANVQGAASGRSGGGAAEGMYTASLTLEYRHGNRPTAATVPFELDVTAPELNVDVSAAIFSPDGDGRRDEVVITQSSGRAQAWEARITDADGDAVRSFSWTPDVDTVRWDGTDTAGNTVPDGTYRYDVAGRDAAGNSAEATIPAMRVDTRPTQLFVTVDRRTLSPNGDGVDDEVAIRAITRRQDGAEYREVAIVDAAGRVVREFRSDRVVPQETITWNGRRDDGSVVDGAYTVRVRVGYDNGARPETTSPTLTVDTTGPELAVDLRGLPFSPDNDGQNDELGIALDVTDRSSIASWTFQILDRNGRPFQRFEGTGRPRDELTWDGRSSDGELVISAEDYPYRFTAVDGTGNASTVEGVVPIDILVVRDGDLLKIQISNINFAPFSPDLELSSDTEEGRKNISVLDRLVEVFDKYRSYEIRVEGHAVNITGTEREEREELLPLSTSRAESVRQALIDRGMDPDRISIVGRGGRDPIVPHTDLDNRWKNRRVEFILIR